jgi:hypothetical protein
MSAKRLVRAGLLCVLSSGCVRTETTDFPLAPLEEKSLLGSAQGDSVLTAQFDLDSGGRSVHGHVAWANSCRRVVVEQSRSRQVTRLVPNHTAGAMAGVGSLGVGVVSAELFSHLDTFSGDETCSTDSDGQTSCSSPREGAAVLGLALAGGALALAAASIATFHTKESIRSDETVAGPVGEPRIVETGVPCGNGAVAGLGVSVYRADERVAASTTDDNGDVSLRLPEWLTGTVAIVADAVPSRYSLVPPGEVLASMNITL